MRTPPDDEIQRCADPVPVLARIGHVDVHGEALAFTRAVVLVRLDPGTGYEREDWLPLAAVRERPAGESIVNRRGAPS